MSAVPQEVPERSPDNKRLDLVSKFKEEYGQALARARISAEHTATDGWRLLYSSFRKEQRDQRRDLSEQLQKLAKSMEAMGLSEDEEKQLGEIKKGAQALRETRDVFDRKTVGPVRQPCDECRDLIAEAMNEATLAEERAPLVNVGLVELMRMTITEAEKVSWDSEEGRVLIRSGN